MKAIKLILASTLISGFSTLVIAGPSPQFWDQQSRNLQAKKTQTATATTVTKETKSCSKCSCSCMLK